MTYPTLQREDQPSLSIVVEASAPESDGGRGTTHAGKHAPAGASASSGGSAPPPSRACRICLQEDEPDTLENPCSCNGSMKWAHHDCLQMWIDEKHDKTCEICGQQFRGAYTEPPPRRGPPPGSLLAQLIDEAGGDRRTLLMRDPQTGEIVAQILVQDRIGGGGRTNVVVGGGGGDRGGPLGQGLNLGVNLGTGAGRDEATSAQLDWLTRQLGRTMALFAVAMTVFLLMAGFIWMTSPSEEGGGHATVWARILLMGAWVVLHTLHTVVYGRQRPTPVEVGYRQAGIPPSEADPSWQQWRRRRR